MKANFLSNISRIRNDIRRYASKVWGLNWAWKIAILLTLFFMLPSLILVFQMGVTSVVPLIGTLLFINDKFEGKKRGVVAFVLGTISQLIIVIMVFSLLVISTVEGTLGLTTILTATVSGMVMLSPSYALAYLFYGLDHKKPDGKIFLILLLLLGITLGIWNAIAVLR